MLWYTREASVATYVCNLPGIWPFLREHIRFLRSNTSYPYGNSALPQYGNISSLQRSRKQSVMPKSDEIELGRPSYSKSATRSTHSIPKPGSEEEILGNFGRKHLGITTRTGSLESDERALNDGIESSGGWGKGMNLEVHVDKTIEVQRGSWDGSAKSGTVQAGNERFRWEVETQAPKVKIEGPEGEVVNK